MSLRHAVAVNVKCLDDYRKHSKLYQYENGVGIDRNIFFFYGNHHLSKENVNEFTHESTVRMRLNIQTAAQKYLAEAPSASQLYVKGHEVIPLLI